ncbi:MAG: hemin uptake protein HemP [Methylobacterium mesophilicum]|nr:hemin uptake protein HemP [Methylobacterium mesophilicum]
MRNVAPSELLRMPAQALHSPNAADVVGAVPHRILSSRTLFSGDREIGIEHAGALYRLKITKQGKLILNK